MQFKTNATIKHSSHQSSQQAAALPQYMPSISVLNAVLNAALWIVHALVALLLQAIYVSIARLQLSIKGRTKATDSNEINLFHWLPLVLLSRKSGALFTTAYWAIALMIYAMLFLPAELLFETGIDVRKDCTAQQQRSVVGVCAQRWDGHSDVGIASAALLVQRFTWQDDEWDVVFQGASKFMNGAEVHRRQNINAETLSSPSRQLFAHNCTQRLSSCEQCGSMTLFDDKGSFSTVVKNASLAETDVFGSGTSDKRYALGDVTYDDALGTAFMFWEMPEETIASIQGVAMQRIHIRGIETILSDDQVTRVLSQPPQPWNITLLAGQTRLYDLRCDTPGLTSRDMARAVSLYRTTQMEQPGVKRTDVGQDLQMHEPFTSSDALKALFAMKAEDGSSTCEGVIPTYTECGSFDWSKAIFVIALSALVVVAWICLAIASRQASSLDVPHDSRTWRKYVLYGSQICSVDLDHSRRNVSDACFVVMKNQTDADSRFEISGDD